MVGSSDLFLTTVKKALWDMFYLILHQLQICVALNQSQFINFYV